ncbi:hypothetical protein [Pseudorhodoferax sp.]|uniref:hypothetical protein n=1 Tax=Pseudorhodoferax sp. TaxID=1993553 RepID=UPI002DD6481E|nr:hypothetical protein [Pseudorhodoferax sp.]
MTHAKRSVLALLNQRTTQGFYAAIFCACLAFAGMLLAPGDHMERLLGLAWLFMLSAIAFLVGKLGLELVLESGS